MVPNDWLPTFPDLPPRHRRVRAWDVAFIVHSTEAYPVPDLLVGLTFLPWFPDQVSHRRLLPAGTSAVSGAYAPFVTGPLAWLAHYPDRVPVHRPPYGPSVAAPPPGAQVVIAQRLAWQARFPDQVPHRRPLQPGGDFSAIAPVVAAGGLPCVELGLDRFASPTFTDQALGVPTALREGLGTPALINEDLC